MEKMREDSDMERKELFSPDYNGSDIPELTTEQVDYIRSQQEKSITIVSNPEDSHYEPDEEKRLTAARKLKVKELCMRCRHELCIRRKEYIN